MDLVDLEDILAIFRPLPRIVEVPKIIEKTVESVVTLPHIVDLESKTTDVIGLKKHTIAKDQKGV